MDRRAFLLAAAAAPFAAPAGAQTPPRTRWTIRESEGFDALCFLGPLSGGALYVPHYEAELAAFRPRLPEAVLKTLGELRIEAEARKGLLAPDLCTQLSGAPDQGLADVIAGLKAAETQVLPAYRASPYWDEASWTVLLAARPRLLSVLEAMRDAGFAEFRRRVAGERLAARIPELRRRVSGLDVIAEQERLVGRALDPDLQIILLWFCKPHGIRIQGQRFLTAADYSDEVTLRTAAHEVLHPPFDMEGPVAKAALEVLSKDPLVMRILAEHDPSFGYNSLEGILNEDTVQALDQIVSERLGVARDPAQRWTRADGGMHVVATGLYGILKSEGYDRTGGNIERWMMDAVRTGKLAPERLHASAAEVMKTPPDKLWPRPAT